MRNCIVTYRGREMSEETFDMMLSQKLIPEAEFLNKMSNETPRAYFEKNSDVFYKSDFVNPTKNATVASYTLSRFERTLLPLMSESFRSLYEIMKPNINRNTEIQIFDNSEDNIFYKESGEQLLGDYNPIDRRIRIHAHQGEQALNKEQTLLHELFHASFGSFIDIYGQYKKGAETKLTAEQIAALQELESLFDAYEYNIKVGNLEATSFIENYDTKMEAMDEFYTEFFTNPAFLKGLNLIPLNRDNKNKPGFIGWIEKVLDSVLKLFGISPNTFASHAMSNVMFLMNTPRPEKHYNRLITKGKELKDILIPTDYTAEKQFENQKKWTKIIEEHISKNKDVKHVVDENGEEQGYYMIDGKKIMGLTKIINKEIRGYQEDYDWIQEKADKEWDKAGYNPEEKLIMGGFLSPVNKQEYIEQKKLDLQQSIARGRIIHYQFQILMGNDVDNSLQKVKELKEEFYLKNETFDWVKDVYLSYLQTMSYTERTKDYSEVPMYSKELGIGTTIDHFIIYDDGEFGINDWKSGKSFDAQFSNIMMKYGDVPGIDITNTPLNAAKLQVMFGALLTKLNYPDAKFKNLTVQRVNKAYFKSKTNEVSHVAVQQYLDLIKLWMKDNHPEVYKKYKNRNLFEVSEYAGLDNSIVAKNQRKGIKPEKAEQLLETEILSIINQSSISPRDIADDESPAAQKQREKLAKTAREIVDLELGGGFVQGWEHENGARDIHIIKRWLASFEDIDNPYLNAYKRIYDKRIHQARREIRKRNLEFEKVLKPVYEDWLREQGKTFNAKLFKNRLTHVAPWRSNGKGLFNFAWTPSENGMTMVLVHKDTHPDLYNSLTENQKKVLDLFHKTTAEFFVGKDALMNRVVNEHGTNKFTNLDTLNKRYQKVSGKKFQYHKGLTPRYYMTLKEVMTEHGLFSQKGLKYIYDKYLTFRIENTWDEWSNEDDIIPVKGMPNDYNTQEDMYTKNLEVMFDKFIRNMVLKDKMDYVYAVGQGIRTYLKMERNGSKMYKNALKFLEDKLLMDILNQVNQTRLTSKMIQTPTVKLPVVTVGSDKKPKDPGSGFKAISLHKLIISLKNLTSASIMWLQPVNGTRNGVFISLINAKDSIRNSLVDSQLEGVEKDFVDFTIKDMLFAHGQVMNMYKDSMIGDVRRNKVYIMAKKLDYLPDNYDWASNENELLTGDMTLLRESTMYMFHTIPEEFNALVIMVAQLNRMKIKTENGTKTMWEAYGQPKDKGNGVYDVDWEGGIRGYNKRGDIVEPITELDGLEIRKLKRVYQRMHGNYRSDERAALEAYAIGQVLIQFRKFLGAIIFGSFGSSRYDQTLGAYQPLKDKDGNVVMKDGKPVMEWVGRMIEGRFRVLAKHMASWLPVLNYSKKYSWAELSPDQKAQVIDAYVTAGFAIMMFAAMGMIFGDDDERDSFRLWVEVIFQNSTQHWNVVDQLRAVRQPPATLEKAYQFMVGSSEMFWGLYSMSVGDSESAFTQEGKFKGWARTQKTIPFFNSLYNVRRFMDNTDFFGDEHSNAAEYIFTRTR